MHPDFLQAAAENRIARYRQQARESALRRTVRAARALRRRGGVPGPASVRAAHEVGPAAPRRQDAAGAALAESAEGDRVPARC
ncbi:hypothetical protein [Streptomonospora litoralis]|nr:hypothetical protein [Streptomonospora litoralis]